MHQDAAQQAIHQYMYVIIFLFRSCYSRFSYDQGWVSRGVRLCDFQHSKQQLVIARRGEQGWGSVTLGKMVFDHKS